MVHKEFDMVSVSIFIFHKFVYIPVSGAWAFLEKGRLSNLHFERSDLPRDAVIELLHAPFIEFLTEDLLNEHSGFNNILSKNDVDELISRKPGFFINTSLKRFLTG